MWLRLLRLLRLLQLWRCVSWYVVTLLMSVYSCLFFMFLIYLLLLLLRWLWLQLHVIFEIGARFLFRCVAVGGKEQRAKEITLFILSRRCRSTREKSVFCFLLRRRCVAGRFSRSWDGRRGNAQRRREFGRRCTRTRRNGRICCLCVICGNRCCWCWHRSRAKDRTRIRTSVRSDVI